MKKLFFILIVSLLAAGGLFAELTIEPSFEAEAELKFGVDFDGDMSTGFDSSATFTAGLTLRDEADEEFGEGDVYGWIKIEDFEISLEAEGGSDYEGGKTRKEFTLEDGATLDIAKLEGATLTLEDGSTLTLADTGSSITDDASTTTTLTAGILVLKDGTTVDLTGATLEGATLTLKDGTKLDIEDVDYDEGTPLIVKWGTIKAHLKFGENVYLDILSGTFDTDESAFGDAAAGRTLNRTGGPTVGPFETAITGADGSKVALGVTNINLGGPATIELGIQSEGTYLKNTDNTYGISLKVDHVIIPDLLSHDLIAVLDLNNTVPDPIDEKKSVAKNNYAVGYNLVPEFSVGDFGIEIPVGIDFVYKAADEEFDLAAKLAVRFDWGTDETEKDTFSDSEYDLASGVELGGRFLIPSSGDQALLTYLRIFDDAGDNGIIPILGVEALVDFDYYLAGDLEGVADLGVGLYLDADLGIVSPYVGIAYTSYDLGNKHDPSKAANKTGEQSVFKAQVGAEVSSIIDNVTFTLDWSSGNLLLEDDGVKSSNVGLRLDESTTSKLGQVTLATKISF